MSSNLQTLVVLIYAMNLHFFTVRSKVAKVMFSHLPVCPQVGVCLSTCWDTAPPSPRERAPREQAPPQSRHPPWEQTPPPGTGPPPREQIHPAPLWSRHPPE